MKLLSEAIEYGLRSVLWMAQRPEQLHKVRDIAKGTRAAPGYLIRVLQSLAKAGILSAQRGSTGGFRLVRDPATLSVLEVVNAIDPIERIHTCPLGLEFHHDGICPMHRRIDDAIAAIEKRFGQSTIKELMSRAPSSHPMCEALGAVTILGQPVLKQ